MKKGTMPVITSHPCAESEDNELPVWGRIEIYSI